MSLTGFLDRWADVPTYDKVIDPARKAVLAALKPTALKDALHGTWLGHPLHPVLVQVPVGAWVSAGPSVTESMTAPLAAAIADTFSAVAETSTFRDS